MLLYFFVFHLSSVLATVTFNEYPHNLAWLFGVGRKAIKNETGTSACNTAECRTIANILENSMNESVNPCDDFYEYTCGNWPRNNPVPPNENTWSFVRKVQTSLVRQVFDLLETDTDPEDLIAVKLGKRYFRTCINHEKKEKDGLDPLITTLNRHGGWPMILDPDEWVEDRYPWQVVDDFYSSLTGKNAFHQVKVQMLYWSVKDSNVLTIIPASLPEGSRRLFSINSYEDDMEKIEEKDSAEMDSQEPGSEGATNIEEDNTNTEKPSQSQREIYAKLIAQVARAVAEAQETEISEKQLEKDIDDMLEFMIRLSKIRSRTDKDLEMSLRNLHEWYNSLNPTHGVTKINWIDKVMRLFDEANVEINSDIKFVLINRIYFENLRWLLEETPQRTIVNYIHWRFVSDVMRATTKKMQLLHDEITGDKGSKSPGSKQDPELYSKATCIEEIEMKHIMSYVFVRKYFPDKMLEEANEMISNLQEEVEERIWQSEWLDEETRNITLEKVRNIKKLIGHPSWYKNSTIMKNYYKGLMVGPSYFENTLSYSRFKLRKELQSLNGDGEEEESIEDESLLPLVVNAWYAPFTNTMFVTAADFQNPLFSFSRPSVINYALVGSIIGHEINHGFDDRGHMYDKKGKPLQWLGKMIEAYDNRVECFIEQYNNYSLSNDNDTVNNDDTWGGPFTRTQPYGIRTRNENIADTMGLEATLGGYYLSREEKNEPTQPLPGLEKFSTEQLFFLSYAVMYCETLTEEAIKKYKRDVHSSGRLRVIGPISNSEKFAKSFNCPIGSPMNPKKKCNIWK